MRTSDSAYGKNPGLKVAQPAQHQEERAASTEHATAAPTFCVAGVLVHALPHDVNDVVVRISDIAGATVHASAGGKLAITLEALDPACILDALTTIQRLPGVMSAVLVSEHSEPLETIDEELNDE